MSIAGQTVAVRVITGSSNNLYYLYGDHLGSTSAIATSSNTLVAGSRAYHAPFGEYRGTAPTQTITDRGYTGHLHNNTGPNGIGLIYMNARFYVPSINRFASADSIVPNPADPQSYNRYSYVRNNPLSYTDPTGHAQQCFDCQETDINTSLQYLAEYGAHEGVFNEFYAAASEERMRYANAMADGNISHVEQISLDEIQGVKAMYYERGRSHLGTHDWLGTMIGGGFNAVGIYELNAHFGPTGSMSGYTGNRAWVDTSTTIAADCSFSADTLVTTEDGLIPISELTVGDYVLAYNEATQETGYYPIEAVWAHNDPIIVYLTIDGEVIETTPEHPFYTKDGEWIPAAELQVGEEIRTAEWSTGRVEAIHFVVHPQLMYNFTVSTAHTFFVGDRQWLVHNDCGGYANTANMLLQRLPERLRGTTIAVTKQANGRILVSLYSRTLETGQEAVTWLDKNTDYDILPAPTSLSLDQHAERQLMDLGYTEIGISRQGGMCGSCQAESIATGTTVAAYKRGR